VTLTDAQLDRYARHIVLKEIGGGGQRRLLGGRALVVGAGGLGSPAILYLAAAGVGTIGVLDDDAVALSNLQRQVLHTTADVGRAKTASAADAVARLNPDVTIIPLAERLTAANAARLMGGWDVVLDGSDSFATRLAVADAAHAAHIPLVSGAIGPFDAQLSVFRGWEADQPCYRCLVGTPDARAGDTCADTGVLGALAGVAGSLMALEAIRVLVPFGEGLGGRLLLLDALTMRMRTLILPKDPGCRCNAA
jgi:molybdopterin-synthase adenylyltransferase